jgi:hypothetical protein
MQIYIGSAFFECGTPQNARGPLPKLENGSSIEQNGVYIEKINSVLWFEYRHGASEWTHVMWMSVDSLGQQQVSDFIVMARELMDRVPTSNLLQPSFE